MNDSTHRAVLIGIGLTLGWVTLVEASELPKILVTSFIDAKQASASRIPNFEARFVAQFESAAAGRAKALLDASNHAAGASTSRSTPIRAPLEADEIRSLADAAGAAFVLVGEWRPTEASTERSSDVEAAVELRSGHSGATEHRYRLAWDASQDGAEGAEMTRVARAILQDLGLDAGATQLARTSRSGESDHISTQQGGSRERGKRTDFLTVKRDQPIEINSEELELLTEGSAKRLIFNHEVLVVQGEMRLFAGYLEAFYPDGASQPERLIASRNVRLTEGNLEVRCVEVIYLRNDGLVICRGDALLVQGCDEVRGEEIVFHLDEERVKVNGAASVVLHLDQDDPSACESGGTG